MKTKVSLLIVFALFLFAGLQAQSKGALIGGLNLANFSGKDIDDTEDLGADVNSKMGAHVGIIGTVPLSKVFDLRGELALSMNGSKIELKDVSTKTHSMFVAQLPVSIIFNIPLPKSKIIPYVGAGPSLGMPVYSHWYLDNKHLPDMDDEYDEDELSKFLIGYQVNVGISYNDLLFEMRLDNSITPVFEDKHSDETFYSNMKLLLGYRF